MAYTNVANSGRISTSTGAGVSWTRTPTTGNLLTGRFWQWHDVSDIPPAAGNCRDSSGTPKQFTLDVSEEDGVTHEWTGIHSLIAPTGTTSPIKNVNVALLLDGIFDEWSGNASSLVVDQTNTNSATGATTASSGAINTGATAGLVLAVLNDDNNGTGTSPAPTSTGTSFVNDVSTAGADAADLGAASSRTASMASQTGLVQTWTLGLTGSYAACIASYNVPVGQVGTSSSDSASLGDAPPFTVGLGGQYALEQPIADISRGGWHRGL